MAENGNNNFNNQTNMNHRVDRALAALRKEYVLIGKTRVQFRDA